MNKINNAINNRFIVTSKVSCSAIQRGKVQTSNKDLEFAQILEKNLINRNSIKLSKHAESRMKSRDIKFDMQCMNKINEAVSKAEKKGIKESLILMKDKAFVISIKNKTIITALNSDELHDNVFTNIDGAVIV